MATLEVPFLDLRKQNQFDFFRESMEEVFGRTQFIMGEDVRRFEEELAKVLGVRHVITVNSCTDATVIALMAAGIKPGDEIITSPFTFCAPAESICQVGAKPVFVDVDPKTFLLDVKKVQELIRPSTKKPAIKGLLPVHLFGAPFDFTELEGIEDLIVIEDCAQATGGFIQNGEKQFLGAAGTAGAFSFFPTKPLGAAGDGGAISTNDDDLAKRARALRVHGSYKKYHSEEIGFNSRLDTLQATILLKKLPNLNSWIEKRRKIAQHYLQEFSLLLEDAPDFVPGHAYNHFTIRLRADQRDRVKEYLKDRKIGTATYYPHSLDEMPAYAEFSSACPVSRRLTREVLSLPIWPEMTDEQIEYVAIHVKKALLGSRTDRPGIRVSRPQELKIGNTR